MRSPLSADTAHSSSRPTTEALIAVGLPLPELAASRRDSFMWSARMYTVTGSPSLADACWDLALREAAHIGDAEVAAVQRARAASP